MASFELQVNRKKHQVDADADTPLLWVLRDNLDLPGTRFGCGIAQCGACTVHMNGVAIRECSTTVASASGASITTIEGLSEEGDHPVQVAWKKLDVPQCGYCQAGQIMTAAALLKSNPSPSEAQIEGAMDGNICRCATYVRIKSAVKRAAESSHS
jgi:isoquinoline 1-oxidoreductase alpha subunit